MCIPEDSYQSLSSAIHRLEGELRVVTNLTFINSGNHTIPTSTYEGFTQQLSLIKDIIHAIDNDNAAFSNSDLAPKLPKFHHINFTDLLPWLPTWDFNFDASNKSTTNQNTTENTDNQFPEQYLNYAAKHHHQQKQFLHMLIEFLLNQQQNFENFLQYVEKLSKQMQSQSHEPLQQHNTIITDDKLMQMELRFEHFASSILQKITDLESKLQNQERAQTPKTNRANADWSQRLGKSSADKESVASPVWQDHTIQSENSSLLGIEQKLDVLHEKFVNFARDTEERLETLETTAGGDKDKAITSEYRRFVCSKYILLLTINMI